MNFQYRELTRNSDSRVAWICPVQSTCAVRWHALCDFSYPSGKPRLWDANVDDHRIFRPIANNKEDESMKAQTVDCEQMSFWQLIFSQSKANGAQYTGETLPTCCWNWPIDTYFQRKRTLRQSSYFLSAESLRTDMAAR
jgi:hypothetical protein